MKQHTSKTAHYIAFVPEFIWQFLYVPLVWVLMPRAPLCNAALTDLPTTRDNDAMVTVVACVAASTRLGVQRPNQTKVYLCTCTSSHSHIASKFNKRTELEVLSVTSSLQQSCPLPSLPP